MIVGGYSLHLYCKVCDNEWWKHGITTLPLNYEFGGINERDAKRQARRAGWVFSKGDCTCAIAQD